MPDNARERLVIRWMITSCNATACLITLLEQTPKFSQLKIPNPKFQIANKSQYPTKATLGRVALAKLRNHFARSAFGVRCVLASLSRTASPITLLERNHKIPEIKPQNPNNEIPNKSQSSNCKPTHRVSVAHVFRFEPRYLLRKCVRQDAEPCTQDACAPNGVKSLNR
jgi:hypothetical protein